MIGLNVGSGQRRFTCTPEVRWINIDKISRPGMEPDVVCDGAHLPYHDSSVDYFVLSHTYEHFGCGEAIGLLKESYRVLREGGSLIVAVPNMMALAKKWVAGEISEYIFMVNTYGAYMGSEEDRHKWGTTPTSLEADIRLAGEWRWVRPFNYRTIPGMDVAADWWITCLEARL
jgi:ubiquinone/menaquinone biosynthesis C-methylase UbiE